MNYSHDIIRRTESLPDTHGSLAAAKANLLAWAEDCDARNRNSGRSLAAVATTGMFAVIGGMVIARIVARSRKPTGVRGWIKKAIATVIFRAVMGRVQRHIVLRTT